mmetsp:Transcript_113535/g.294056  ORF Transcript_113535/g.294056 Transcript_113535/m.294056 type:complete len:226 (-) Transcript_113535:1190-1867(-)
MRRRRPCITIRTPFRRPELRQIARHRDKRGKGRMRGFVLSLQLLLLLCSPVHPRDAARALSRLNPDMLWILQQEQRQQTTMKVGCKHMRGRHCSKRSSKVTMSVAAASKLQQSFCSLPGSMAAHHQHLSSQPLWLQRSRNLQTHQQLAPHLGEESFMYHRSSVALVVWATMARLESRKRQERGLKIIHVSSEPIARTLRVTPLAVRSHWTRRRSHIAACGTGPMW